MVIEKTRNWLVLSPSATADIIMIEIYNNIIVTCTSTIRQKYALVCINVVRLQLASVGELRDCTLIARGSCHDSLSGTPYRCARLPMHISGSSANELTISASFQLHLVNCMLCYC